MSPRSISRGPAWWCGLAALPAEATMAKFTLSWPSAMSRCERSVDTCASVRPSSEITALELRGHTVGRRASGGERRDLGGVLALPQRTDDLDRPPEHGRRQAREQVDEEAGPRLVTDHHGARPPGEVRHDRHRVLGLAPRAQREHPGLLDDTRRLEPGDDEGGVTVLRQDQHRQALEGHGQVARKIAGRSWPTERSSTSTPRSAHQRADPLDRDRGRRWSQRRCWHPCPKSARLPLSCEQ